MCLLNHLFLEIAYSARIFTVEEELMFAGHPILRACSVLHEKMTPNSKESEFTLNLPAKSVFIQTVNQDGYYVATMDQGSPEL